MLPAGIWPHVFQAQRQLPKLRHLAAVWTSPFDTHVCQELCDQSPQDLALSSADIRCMLACCPALEELQVSLQADADLAPLSQLTGMGCRWM